MAVVVVLGASPKPERYSYQALQMLLEYGYAAIPVHPREEQILGQRCVKTMSAITDPVDTITVYLGMKNSTPLIEAFLALRPRRVILNPGAENPALAEKLRAAGITVVEACTLVLLKTGQF